MILSENVLIIFIWSEDSIKWLTIDLTLEFADERLSSYVGWGFLRPVPELRPIVSMDTIVASN